MIQRHWVITCDWCGDSQHLNGHNSKRYANNYLKNQLGWLIGKFGKDHFCSQECKDKWNEDRLKEVNND